jgi:hypothetical protein
MHKTIWLAALTLMGTIAAGYESSEAAPQTWNGMISDSSCKDDHGGEVDPRECTVKCVKNGDKYVLMIDGYTKVLPIANQDFVDLPAHAGQTVKATGEIKDGALVLTRLD